MIIFIQNFQNIIIICITILYDEVSEFFLSIKIFIVYLYYLEFRFPYNLQFLNLIVYAFL